MIKSHFNLCIKNIQYFLDKMSLNITECTEISFESFNYFSCKI